LLATLHIQGCAGGHEGEPTAEVSIQACMVSLVPSLLSSRSFFRSELGFSYTSSLLNLLTTCLFFDKKWTPHRNNQNKSLWFLFFSQQLQFTSSGRWNISSLMKLNRSTEQTKQTEYPALVPGILDSQSHHCVLDVATRLHSHLPSVLTRPSSVGVGCPVVLPPRGWEPGLFVVCLTLI
jgi:hypothetical protein